VEPGIELDKVIDAVRTQLADVASRAADADVRFPVQGVDLEFQVGVTMSADAKGGVKFWVLDIGAGAHYESRSVQTVRVRLGEPETRDGTPLRVTRHSTQKP
jgi:hypothetical protein